MDSDTSIPQSLGLTVSSDDKDKDGKDYKDVCFDHIQQESKKSDQTTPETKTFANNSKNDAKPAIEPASSPAAQQCSRT